MKAPVVALKQPGNHGPHAGSICQKICPQRPKPGKYDYFAQPESYSRSGAWEFLLTLLRHEVLKSIFVVGVPSRQRWAVLDEIFCGPLNTLLIHLPRDRIVRAENVEITVPHGIDHEIDDLLGRPGIGRFLRASRDACEGEAGDQQVRRNPAAIRV